MRKIFLINFILLWAILFPGLSQSYAQLIVAGTVYDSSKLYVIPNVQVLTTAGNFVYTDSIGRYEIDASEHDSISFYYGGKFTLKFPVNKMKDYND